MRSIVKLSKRLALFFILENATNAQMVCSGAYPPFITNWNYGGRSVVYNAAITTIKFCMDRYLNYYGSITYMLLNDTWSTCNFPPAQGSTCYIAANEDIDNIYMAYTSAYAG